MARIAIRTNNPYGKTDAQRAEIAEYVETVEPFLRGSATLELDGRRAVRDLADTVTPLLGPSDSPN